MFWSRTGNDSFLRRSIAFEEYLISAHVEPLEYLPSCLRLRSSDRSINSVLIVKRSKDAITSDEVPVFYYPFLEAHISGTSVPTTCDPKTGFMVVGPHHDAVGIEKHSLAVERIGSILSISSVVIFLLGLTLLPNTNLANSMTQSRYRIVLYFQNLRKPN